MRVTSLINADLIDGAFNGDPKGQLFWKSNLLKPKLLYHFFLKICFAITLFYNSLKQNALTRLIYPEKSLEAE